LGREEIEPIGKAVDREALIAELQKAGVKHNADDILRIAKKPDGTIVFLERGNLKSGLQHILENHASDFFKRGIPQEQISDHVRSISCHCESLSEAISNPCDCFASLRCARNDKS